MAAVVKLHCPSCLWWVDGAVIGEEVATRKLAEHRQQAHPATFPRESKLFVLPGGDIPAPRRAVLCATDGHIVRDGRCAWCGETVPPVPFGEPDDAEARAYLDALRMVARWLEEPRLDSPMARGAAIILADIRRVVGICGRTLELGGAREGRS